MAVELSSTAGTVTRTFTIGGGGADLTIGVTMSNGAATTAGITKAGSGRLILTTNNTYNGATIINAGTLVVSNQNALQSSTVSNVAGVVAFGAGISAYNFGGLAGSQDLALTNAGGGAVALSVGGNGANTVYAGNLTQGGSLTKAGSGTLTLTGANTYSGQTTINAGTLQVGNGGAAGALGSGTVSNFATLAFNRSDLFTNANFIAGTGSVVQKGSGSTLILTGNNTYSGGTTITNSTLQVGNGGASGALGSGTVALKETGNIVFNRSDNQTLLNTFTWAGTTNIGGKLTQSGTGNLTLQGSQDLRRLETTAGAGALTVSGSTLRLGVSGQYAAQIGTAAGTTITITNSSLTEIPGGQSFLYKDGTGTLYLGNATSVGFNTGGGGLVINGGALDILGSLQTNLKGRRFVFEAAADNVLQFNGTFANVLGGTGDGQIGWGRTNSNGGFAARGGAATVNIGGSGAALTYQNPSSFTQYGFIASGRTLVFGSETSDNVVTFQNPLNLAGAVQTIKVIGNANPNNAAVLSGALSNGGLIKEGTGLLSLSATNTYTGQTTINLGRLAVNGSLASTTVVVSAGASLGGAGKLAGLVKGAGSVDPGNSAGILTANQVDATGGGALSFNFEITNLGTLAAPGNPNYASALNSFNDVLRITNSTTPFVNLLGAANTVNLYLATNLNTTIAFTGGFFTDKNSDFISSITNATYRVYLQSPGGAVTYNGSQYNQVFLSYFSVGTIATNAFGTGGGYVSEFQLTIIPESSTLFLCACGTLAVWFRRRSASYGEQGLRRRRGTGES